MNPRELENHYERRLQNVLKLHCKIVLADKRTSPMWKENINGNMKNYANNYKNVRKYLKIITKT